jgi:ribosome-binding factor A
MPSRDAAIVDKLGAMTDRMRRVNESVRQVLSEALLELKDPRIGFVTVTGVTTSQDLRQATVYVSVLGSPRKQEKTMAGLGAAHGVLQTYIARELRLKRTPQLTFEYDQSVERGVRMTQLIDELAPHTDDSDDDADHA